MVKSVSTILLVEDNPDDVDLTLHALKLNNILNPVDVVRDGQEALDYLAGTGKYAGKRDNIPSLILLDLKLPKVDGVEVLKKIKEEKRLKKIPVVVLTSSKEENDMVRSYNLGVNSYIQKPVDFNQFVDTIKHIGYYWLVLNKGVGKVL